RSRRSIRSEGRACMSRTHWAILALILGSASLPGCVVYEPVPAYYPGGSNFDRAWNAALGAAQDAGVQVTSAEPTSGLIRGTKEGIDVVDRKSTRLNSSHTVISYAVFCLQK